LDIFHKHINVKELAMVEKAFAHWGPALAHHQVCVYIDNMTALAQINNQQSRNETAISIEEVEKGQDLRGGHCPSRLKYGVQAKSIKSKLTQLDKISD
jgi:hypothetical protein